jgi:hypothetical protein
VHDRRGVAGHTFGRPRQLFNKCGTWCEHTESESISHPTFHPTLPSGASYLPLPLACAPAPCTQMTLMPHVALAAHAACVSRGLAASDASSCRAGASVCQCRGTDTDGQPEGDPLSTDH